jgi:hypothetical protein
MPGGIFDMKKSTPSAIPNIPDVLTLLAIACAIAAFAAVAYYILFPSRGYFHSDCADTLYWAQASYDAKALFNHEFKYASLLPFGGSLLMLPWISWFGVSMTTQTIGMLLFLVLFTAAVIFLFRTFGWNAKWIASLVAILLALLSLSEKSREIFWGHIIYYSLTLLFVIVGLALALRAWSHSGMALADGMAAGGIGTVAGANPRSAHLRRFWTYSTLLFIWFLLCSTNGIQAIAVFAVPLIFALLSQWFFQGVFDGRKVVKALDSPEYKRGNLLVLLMLTGSLLGLVLGLLLAGGIQALYENGYSTFSASTQWVNNLSMLMQHWALLMGVQTTRGEFFISRDGILDLIKLGACLLTWIVPLLMLMMYRRIKDRAIRVLVLAHWGLTAVILFAYIFGSLATAAWRLTPIVGSSIMLCVVFAKWLTEETGARRFLVLTVLPLALASLVSLVTLVRMPPDFGQDRGLFKMRDFLAEQELSYGYATFWNANSITVLSNSRIKIRSVEIDEDQIIPYYYQGSRSWYEDQDGQERYFLLLTPDEYGSWIERDPALAREAIATLDESGFVVLIFKNNIFP